MISSVISYQQARTVLREDAERLLASSLALKSRFIDSYFNQPLQQ